MNTLIMPPMGKTQPQKIYPQDHYTAPELETIKKICNIKSMERLPYEYNSYKLTCKNELTKNIDVYRVLWEVWEEGWRIGPTLHHNYEMFYFIRQDLFMAYHTLYCTPYEKLPLYINYPIQSHPS